MADRAYSVPPGVEAFARRCDPHVWALDPPDISSAIARKMSLLEAQVRLGYLWWNPVSEVYETIGKEATDA